MQKERPIKQTPREKCVSEIVWELETVEEILKRRLEKIQRGVFDAKKDTKKRA